jgi:hypothetical protein
MTEFNGGIHGMFRQIIVGIAIAAVAGSAAFATTRASSGDVVRVEVESKLRDNDMLVELTRLRSAFHQEEIQQAEFRAEVRGALSNWDERFGSLPRQ